MKVTIGSPEQKLSLGVTPILRRQYIKNNANGERCSAYFRVIRQKRCGYFIKIATSNGQYVFNKYNGRIHYIDPGNLFVTQVAEHTYCVAREEVANEYICEFYTATGGQILTGYSELKSDEKPKLSLGRYIILKADGLWGFFDDDMNEVIKPKYNYVKELEEVCCYVCKTPEGTAELLNANLEKIADLDPDYCYSTIEGEKRYIKQDRGLITGLIDLQGKQIVPCVYSYVWIKGDFIEVERCNKCGLYTADGKVVFECIYPEIIDLEDKFVVEEFPKTQVMKRNSEVLK